MNSYEEYKYCINIIKKFKNEFNVFDVMSLLEIYFDCIVFYPSVSKDISFYSQKLGIKKVSKNYPLEFNIYMEQYSLWSFTK